MINAYVTFLALLSGEYLSLLFVPCQLKYSIERMKYLIYPLSVVQGKKKFLNTF